MYTKLLLLRSLTVHYKCTVHYKYFPEFLVGQFLPRCWSFFGASFMLALPSPKVICCKYQSRNYPNCGHLDGAKTLFDDWKVYYRSCQEDFGKIAKVFVRHSKGRCDWARVPFSCQTASKESRKGEAIYNSKTKKTAFHRVLHG